MFDCLAGTPQTAGYIPGTDLSRWNDLRTYYGRQDSAARDGSVIYLGNSLIQGMPITDGLNWGIGGEDMRMLINRLECSVIHRAGYCVLMTGTVDMGQIDYYGTYPDLVATVKLLYDKVFSWITGRWVVCTMPPVSTPNGPIRNEDIREVNAHIVSLERRGIVIADVAPVLTGSSGELLSHCHTGDGIHLNAVGYQRIRPVIESAKDSL